MSVFLTHSQIRAFAKSLRVLTGERVRHSEIIEDIAASVGLRPDAMMHSLKKADSHRLPAFKEMALGDALKAMSSLEVCEKMKQQATVTDVSRRKIRDAFFISILNPQSSGKVALRRMDNAERKLELSDDAIRAIARRLTSRVHASAAVTIDQVMESLSDAASSGAEFSIPPDTSIADMFANSGHTVIPKFLA